MTFSSVRVVTRLVGATLAAALMLATLSIAMSDVAFGHLSGCHRWHSCPSDHATYRWRGLLCVSPASGESTSGYPIRVVYAGRVYYCKH
jgi:hypothetical protein